MPDTPPSSPLPCDCCGADMQARLDELIHVSGTLNGQECNHIHLCPQCAAGLSLPRIAVAPGKVEQCTVRLDGGKVCEASRRVLDEKFNMEC